MIRRPTIYVASLVVVTTCVVALFISLQLVTSHHDYRLYSEDRLLVITNMGKRTSPPICLVVNASGKPVANFTIAGEGQSTPCYYKTDDSGKTEITLAMSVNIGDIYIDMLGVRSIVVVLRTD